MVKSYFESHTKPKFLPAWQYRPLRKGLIPADYCSSKKKDLSCTILNDFRVIKIKVRQLSGHNYPFTVTYRLHVVTMKNFA